MKRDGDVELQPNAHYFASPAGIHRAEFDRLIAWMLHDGSLFAAWSDTRTGGPGIYLARGSAIAPSN